MQRGLISGGICIISKISIRSLLHESLIDYLINYVLHFFKLNSNVFYIPPYHCILLFINLLSILLRLKIFSKRIRKYRLIQSNVKPFKIFKQFLSF